MRFFDAHLDLAYLAEIGRDMLAPLHSCAGSLHPASITLPSMREGRVEACLGTIFTQGVPPDSPPSDDLGPFAYAAGDAEDAHRAARRQLEIYRAWARAGEISLFRRNRAAAPASPTPHVAILMEGADPIRTPDELPAWTDAGLVAIGMAWWQPSRYAGGNGTDLGLTDLGRALARAIDALGLVHDLSHLSQRATDELLAVTTGPVIASHSNCRSLLGGRDNPAWQRHLDDEVVREISRRGGVIGLNLVRNFIRFPLGGDERPSIDEAARHVAHIASIAGDHACVGLGTDMDGGIKATDLPLGIDRPADLPKLLDALRAMGWSERDLDAFAWRNWARFWGIDHAPTPSVPAPR